MTKRRVVLPDAEALAEHVAGWLTDLAATATGRFAIALSGGSTPRRLYQILAEPRFSQRLDWGRIHLFWGDERFVPPDDPASNFRMAREALLDHVPIPPANIHRVPTEGTPEEAAKRYESELQTYYGDTALDSERPLFDVILLGLGDNGHTASLFPGTPALDELRAWVVPVTVDVPQPRLTLTYPVIASSKYVAFLVAGRGKREVVQRVWSGDRSLPATRVATIGETVWFLDAEAAGE